MNALHTPPTRAAPVIPAERLALQRLRTLLFGLAAALFAGTIVELILAGHTDGPVQWIPFGLCGLALIALGTAWLRPRRGATLALRLVMVVVAAGSLLGITEHALGNYDFARETRPAATNAQLLRATLKGGDPFLAPGILAAAAVVAVAATFATVRPSPGAEDSTNLPGSEIQRALMPVPEVEP